MHYGIRKDDMHLIETLCQQHSLDPDWLREDVLKRYHEELMQQGDAFGDKAVEKILEKAVQKIK